MTGIAIRAQRPDEAPRIARVIGEAFAGHPHSDVSEAAIYQRLHADSLDVVSLVAVTEGGDIVGHAVWSEVTIDDRRCGWCGLGPLAVLSRWQGRGIGSALVEAGLAALRSAGWHGCVVLGDPAFYGRFGFRHDPGLSYPGPPPGYFQRMTFDGAAPRGEVRYAPAFG